MAKENHYLELIELMKEDDESLQSHKFEYVGLSDYDSIVSALDAIIKAYSEANIYREEASRRNDYEDILFTQEEKQMALVWLLNAKAKEISAKVKF